MSDRRISNNTDSGSGSAFAENATREVYSPPARREVSQISHTQHQDGTITVGQRVPSRPLDHWRGTSPTATDTPTTPAPTQQAPPENNRPTQQAPQENSRPTQQANENNSGRNSGDGSQKPRSPNRLDRPYTVNHRGEVTMGHGPVELTDSWRTNSSSRAMRGLGIAPLAIPVLGAFMSREQQGEYKLPKLKVE